MCPATPVRACTASATRVQVAGAQGAVAALGDERAQFGLRSGEAVGGVVSGAGEDAADGPRALGEHVASVHREAVLIHHERRQGGLPRRPDTEDVVVGGREHAAEGAVCLLE